jgi:hypothetical protein
VSEEVGEVCEPGLLPWLNVATSTLERVVLCLGVGLGVMVVAGVAFGGLPRFFAVAYYALLLAGAVRPVALWFFGLRTQQRPLETPPWGVDQPRLVEADLVSLPLLLPVGAYAARYFTGLAWSLSAALAALLLDLGAVLPLACQWSLRRRKPDLRAPEAFRQQAAEYGCLMELHGVAPSGHATLVIDAPDGPQLVWYLHYAHPEDPPADAVLRMYAHLRVHGLKRGWIIAPRPPTRKLFRYAHDLCVTLATPEWFIAGLARASDVEPELPDAPPAGTALGQAEPDDR